MKVELIWDAECPNVRATRANLKQAFSAADIQADWQEWDRDDPEAPVYVQNYGSPTILIDGRDVAKLRASRFADGNCCRVYRESDGQLVGVPPTELILAALMSAKTASQSPTSGSDLQK